jgi:hypothetical protein
LPWPPSSSRTGPELFHRQRTKNAVDHITWEYHGFPPAAALWGDWGDEDDQLTNQTVKTGALGKMCKAAGRAAAAAATCTPLHPQIPHDLRALVYLVAAAVGRGPASSVARPAHLVIDYAPYGLPGKFGREAANPDSGSSGMWGIVIFDMTCARLRLKEKQKIIVSLYVKPAEPCLSSAVDRCPLACQMPSHLTPS